MEILVKLKKLLPVFEDERGAIYNILELPVNHVGLITSTKGAVRGNHYHGKQTQYTYFVSGKGRYTEKDVKRPRSTRRTVILGAGDLVETSPGVAHVIEFLQDSIILDITTKSRKGKEYEEDTTRLRSLGSTSVERLADS
jgi:dTDP-4-dehydrorhamnose 3,5-epimerase-like enzyme